MSSRYSSSSWNDTIFHAVLQYLYSRLLYVALAQIFLSVSVTDMLSYLIIALDTFWDIDSVQRRAGLVFKRDDCIVSSIIPV